jgi:tRNA pseudouridine55 synthase
MARKKKGDPVHGWVCLDKPYEMTSTAAVSKIRWLFQAQKAGHAGTLDPLATGILPIALGEATKTVPYLMEADKVYSFTITFGTTTDSYDAEGAVTAQSDARPTREALEAIIPNYIGVIEQVPPAFSAIKIDGKRAYDLARQGVEVELKAREIEVFDLTLDAFDTETATLTQGYLCPFRRPRPVCGPGRLRPRFDAPARGGRRICNKERNNTGKADRFGA